MRMNEEDFLVWLSNAELSGTIGHAQEAIIRDYVVNLQRHLRLFANKDKWKYSLIYGKNDRSYERYVWDDSSDPMTIASIALGDY